MQNKVTCLYTRHFLRVLFTYMQRNSLEMCIDASGLLWHIDDFKDGEFCPNTNIVRKDY